MVFFLIPLVGVFFAHAGGAAVVHAGMLAAPNVIAGITGAGSLAGAATVATTAGVGGYQILKAHNKEQGKIERGAALGKERSFGDAIEDAIEEAIEKAIGKLLGLD